MNESQERIERLSKFKELKTVNSTGASLRMGQVASALIDAGGIKSRAARYLGCSYSSLNNFMESNPELYDIQEQARVMIVELAEGKLVDKIRRGDLGAIKFFLSRRGKDYGWSTRQEITGADGQDLFHITEDDTQNIIDSFVKVSSPKSNDGKGDIEDAEIIPD